MKCLRLPPRIRNLNAFSERWVRSVKSKCLSKLILFGEASLRRALTNFCQHYYAHRPHQAMGASSCKERLGGLLKYYCRAALSFLTLRRMSRVVIPQRIRVAARWLDTVPILGYPK